MQWLMELIKDLIYDLFWHFEWFPKPLLKFIFILFSLIGIAACGFFGYVTITSFSAGNLAMAIVLAIFFLIFLLLTIYVVTVLKELYTTKHEKIGRHSKS